jgi:NAD(P)H-hydrate epimerase
LRRNIFLNNSNAFPDETIKAMLPARTPGGHKGTFGHVLSICGSERYQGAAVLAALGAVHSGAGLVTAAFPRVAYVPIASKLTVTPLLPLPGNRQGTLRLAALQQLRGALPGKTAVLLGCGLGLNADTIALTGALLREITVPLVLDADGLNAISGINSQEPHMDSQAASAPALAALRSRACPCPVLTPHPGEMARLCGLAVEEIRANPAEIARQFAQDHQVVLVLKGANTIVAAPNQPPVPSRLPPNAGLAKGGSGDLLAGIIVSLLAQGCAAYQAAVCGVYLHALAAARAAASHSASGMTALDCVEELKRISIDQTGGG